MNAEACNLAIFARDQGRHLATVMRAIQLDAKHNDGRDGADLAAVGQYLADDLNGYMDSEAERIQRGSDK